MKDNQLSDYARRVVRTSKICMGTNGLLSLLKLTAGLLGSSHALIADGIDSAADVLSGLLVMLGARIAGRASDKEHPYGHERFESAASFFLANLLGLCGLGIGYAAVHSILTGEYLTGGVPSALTLIAAGVSIAVKGVLWQYTSRTAKQLASGSLRADALNYRNDMLASAGTLLGLLGSRLGLPLLDPLLGLLITLLILKTAAAVYRESLEQMVDKACDLATEQQLHRVIADCPGVESVDLLKTRMFENKIYADIEITADAALTLEAAHRIAEEVHDRLESQFPQLKHCMVHVNPSRQSRLG